MLQKRVGDGLARRNRLVHADLESQCLCVDVANVDTTLMGEEDVVAITVRIDADVVLGVGRMGEEGFNDEVVESARDGLDLDIHTSNQQLSWYGEQIEGTRVIDGSTHQEPCRLLI